MGFTLDDAKLRRAGLDYHEWATVQEHQSFDDFLAKVKPNRCLALSTRGRQCYAEVHYQPGDALLFGPETRGLPKELLNSLPESQRLTIPMRSGSRSLNLSNAVALVLYEAWRQNTFKGAGT